MGKEQQIEEMARSICHRCRSNKNCGIDNKPCNAHCFLWSGIAADFYKAGYRKASEIVDEIVSLLETTCRVFGEDYCEHYLKLDVDEMLAKLKKKCEEE